MFCTDIVPISLGIFGRYQYDRQAMKLQLAQNKSERKIVSLSRAERHGTSAQIQNKAGYKAG
jgi:hypothetical protein